MQSAYYAIALTVILGITCMAWGLKHISNKNRKHYVAEVGGVACTLGGVLLGLAMMGFFDLARVDPALGLTGPATEATQPR